jgi:putative peptidoglycan lipid II flippase
MAPVAVAMMVLGRPIATLLFAHGRSAAPTVGLLGVVVAAFGLALVPFTGYMILQRGFYALQDTRTPALVAAGVSAFGVAGCTVAGWLLPPAGIVVGVAVAYAVAYTGGLVATAVLLRRSLGRIDGRRLVRTHLRALGAAGVAAAAALVVARTLAPVAAGGWAGALATVAPAGAVGLLGYVAAARLLRLSELRLYSPMAMLRR